ncbi:MAG: hypothetical protein HQ572_02410 [Candidatus Omnitrophica bacterium]|nr:hypothetical protein [Candidatus Omnitrophota bacterium]
MLKSLILIIPVLFFILSGAMLPGCGSRPEPDKVIAKINSYDMSLEDFKNEMDYTFINERGRLSNDEILDLAIRRELLVQEAQRLGLDKEVSFMKTIERYWKQTLIKELLDKKSKEISSDKMLTRDQKNRAMEDWYRQLYNKANIQKNERILEELR